MSADGHFAVFDSVTVLPMTTASPHQIPPVILNHPDDISNFHWFLFRQRRLLSPTWRSRNKRASLPCVWTRHRRIRPVRGSTAFDLSQHVVPEPETNLVPRLDGDDVQSHRRLLQLVAPDELVGEALQPALFFRVHTLLW